MSDLIVDDSERWVVAPLHHHADMLVLDTHSGETKTIAWDDAQNLESRTPVRDIFILSHRLDGRRYRISLHPFDAPTSPVARAVVSSNGRAEFEGTPEAWNKAPRVFYGWFGQEPGYGALILVDAQAERAELQELNGVRGWPDDAGASDVVEVPESNLVVISIHHDTSDPRPLIYDPDERAVIGRIPLVGKPIGHGQSNPQFLRSRPEAWLKDYANLQRHQLPGWELAGARRLQPPRQESWAGRMRPVHLWMGGACFNRDESLCAVARPYSGDVLGIDVDSFRVTHRAVTGGEPVDVVLLSDRRIFTLEWKSGKVRHAKLEPWEPDEEFPYLL